MTPLLKTATVVNPARLNIEHDIAVTNTSVSAAFRNESRPSMNTTEKQAWIEAFQRFEKLSAEAKEDFDHYLERHPVAPEIASKMASLIEGEAHETTRLQAQFRQSRQQANLELLKNREGDLLGKYKLLQLIGFGGMSAIYLAKRVDTNLQRKVAVKMQLLPTNSKKMTDAFLQEQLLLSRLNHPHVISMLHGSVTEDGIPYLVMEYLPQARNISQWVKQEKPGPDRIVNKCLQLCQAVAHAHANRIVHSDIKPGNILIDCHGQAKLLDFGIASFLTWQMPHLSQQGLSPSFAAPEQLQGAPVTQHTDIYATGVVIASLLCGGKRVLPKPRSLDKQADKFSLLQNLRQYRVPVDLQAILLKATASDPQHRYRNMEQLQADLANWLHGKPLSIQPDSHLYRLRLWTRRNKKLAVSLALLTVLAVTNGLTLWLLYHSR